MLAVEMDTYSTDAAFHCCTDLSITLTHWENPDPPITVMP